MVGTHNSGSNPNQFPIGRILYRALLPVVLFICLSMRSQVQAQNYLGGFQNAAHDQHEDLVAGITHHIEAIVSLP